MDRRFQEDTSSLWLVVSRIVGVDMYTRWAILNRLQLLTKCAKISLDDSPSLPNTNSVIVACQDHNLETSSNSAAGTVIYNESKSTLVSAASRRPHFNHRSMSKLRRSRETCYS